MAPQLKTTIKTPTGREYEQPLGLFINNEWVNAKKGQTFEVINPTNEEVITSVQEATEEVCFFLSLPSPSSQTVRGNCRADGLSATRMSMMPLPLLALPSRASGRRPSPPSVERT